MNRQNTWIFVLSRKKKEKKTPNSEHSVFYFNHSLHMENATTMTMRALLNLTAVSSSPFNNNHPNHRPFLPSLRNCGFTTAGNNPRCRELTAIQTPQPAVSDNTRPQTPCFNEVLQYNNLYFFSFFFLFNFLVFGF